MVHDIIDLSSTNGFSFSYVSRSYTNEVDVLARNVRSTMQNYIVKWLSWSINENVDQKKSVNDRKHIYNLRHKKYPLPTKKISDFSRDGEPIRSFSFLPVAPKNTPSVLWI